MNKLKKHKKDFLFLFVILVLSIPSILGVLHSGFFVSDDGNWMVIRLSAFYETLRGGQFPVRFIARLNNGYGYPVSDFLYPGFLYLGSLIHLFKIPFVETTKLIFGGALIFSAISSYLWLGSFFKRNAALLGGLIYLYLPYHLYDVYTRGSIGEVIAVSLFPFILYSLDKKYDFLTGVLVFLLIISHNSLAFIFFPVIIIYVLIIKDRKNVLKAFVPIVLGILMSSFFIIPALYDLRYTVFYQTQVSNWENYFAPLNIISYLSIAVYFLYLLYFVIKKDIDRKAIFFLMIGIASTFMASNLSFFIWKFFPANLIQFPFRFLSISLISTAFLAGFLLNKLNPKSLFIGVIVIIGLLSVNNSYLLPKTYQYYPEGFYSTNLDTTTVKNEYMPKWVIQAPQNLYTNKINTKYPVNNLIVKPSRISFSINQLENGIVLVNTIYFPGWNLFVDGNHTLISYKNSNGLISFNLEKGSHQILLKFSETNIRIIADLISIFSFFILLLYLLGKKNKILQYD